MIFLNLSRLQTMESARNKMQKLSQFASEHRQRILRISYITLVLPIFIVTSMLHAALSQPS
jgi:hypothetical protein